MSTQPNVVHIKNDTITPAMRTGLALGLGAAVLIFGLVGQAFGVLEGAVSIAVVTVFHMAFNWKAPAGSSRGKTSRLSGTFSQAKMAFPILAVFLDRGSRLVELGIGFGKGVAFLAAKYLFTWIYGLVLHPVNILGHSLPWVGIAFLIVGAAMAWNFDGFMALVRPLVKIRPTTTARTTKDTNNA